MTTGIIIIFIASCIFVFATFAIASWYFSFENMQAEVCRYNFYCLAGREWLAKIWRKKIQKKLEQSPIELSDFLQHIEEKLISEFDLGTVIRGAWGKYLDYYSGNYAIAKKRHFLEAKGLLAELGHEEIKKHFPACLYSNCLLAHLSYYLDVAIPALKIKLLEISDIAKLEEIKDFAGCKEYKKLIDEREVEILKNDHTLHPNCEYFFVIFDSLQADSPAEKYMLEKFSDFFGGKEFNKHYEEDSKSFILGLASRNVAVKKLTGFILEKFVPGFSEAEIEEWFPSFSSEPEYVAIFTERMKILYANEGIEILAERWNNYSKFPDIDEVFDELLLNKIKKTHEDSYKSLWAYLPLQSKAWLYTARHLHAIERREQGMAPQE